MSRSNPRSASRTRFVMVAAALFFGLAILAYQVYFARSARAASSFGAGNLVVYRVGDGTAALGSTATAVFLDEYTPAGVLVQSIPMPTSVAGSDRRLTASGSASNEGFLTRSSDGQYLALTGYDAALGTASVAGTTSSAVNRVVGRVDSSGATNTTTVFAGTAGNSFSGGGPRSVASDGGTNFWAVGSVSGVQYITLGATSSTQVSNTSTNLRGSNIFDGQLYISSGAGAIRMGAVGTGIPTTSGQSITNLPGFPATPTITGFFFADLDAATAGMDTLYVADDSSNQIQKYSLVSGSWVARGTIAVAAARGLTGSVQGTTVTLFGTSGSAGTTLYSLTDNTGYNGTIAGSVTQIATAGANKAFRGVAFAPGAATTNPTGTGAANPNSVVAGGSTLLTVTVTPGTNPTSTGLAVTANLTSIGGADNQAFHDDGINGDAAPGDNVFSFSATVDGGTSSGAKTLPFAVNDAQARSSSANIELTVTSPTPTNPTGTGTSNPNSVLPGGSTLLSVNVTPGTNPTSTGLAVAADLSSIGGSANQSFSGSGNAFTFTATVAIGTTPGAKTLPFTITDAQSRSGGGSISLTVQTPPPTNNVVISQVYGGGGNTGSTLKNDYIELINHSSAPVSLNGWSVQVFSTTTSTWNVTPLTNFTLQPGQYYLVQESQGAGGTDDLPTPDAVGTILVSSTSGKVALVNTTTTLTGNCPSSGIVDFIGYGTTDCFEGSGTAPILSNTTADFRLNGGCFDTNDNSVDFVTGSPNPHNSSSATHDCTGLSAVGSANPSTVLQGNSSTLTVNVAPGQNPTSTGITVTADLSLIGGSASQPFSGSGTTFTFVASVPANNLSGMKSLAVTVADGEGRTANTNILLSVLSTTPEHVTISQVYGGGGNAGATYANDYVELYNPTAAPISMTGWSLQYGAATGSTFTGKTVLGGSIAPGAYYLVRLASGGTTGAPLPPASVTSDINMAAAAGKIVLVSNSATLIGACPVGTDPDIVDFVGYGTTANCHEGTANAPAPSNTIAIFRKTNGGTDTDQNGNDFLMGPANPRSTSPIVEFGPSVAGTDPTTNDLIAPYDSSITVDFSEAVDVVGAWYNITCANTGLHNDATVAHTNDFKTYAITPNTVFQFGEQCTVTIGKDQIHDQDTDDSGPDTDTMSADYVWSFTVVGAGQPAPYPPSVHLTMGNPSNAVSDVNQADNYLMMKPTYALSYNRDKGTPNWVSWHLDPSWYGTLARVDTFRPDPAVPADWYRVQAFDFAGAGFDRGHMTPNADRDNQNRIPINQETYLMSNMVPQAPDNNQGPWANLEADLRTLADAGNELYIVSGPSGVGGVGSVNGNTVNTLANGHVTVPAFTWKVALVLPQGENDLSRATCSSRTIAVLMPNTQGIRNTPWQSFLTSVDAIQQLTGYDFYSNLPPAVQACVEGGVNGTNPPGTANQSATTAEETPVTVTLQALQANNNSLTFSIVTGPTAGSLGAVGSSSCSAGTCTATVTYTPGADFNGSDSFTFRASDGSVNSNTSTVNVGVTEVNDPPSASDDSKSTPEDTPLSFPSTDLTANDSAGPANESGQVLNVTSVTDAGNAHGTVILNSGVVTYTPATNYNGPAAFTYTVCDDGTTNGSSDQKCVDAMVNLTVEAVNDNPVAVADSATTNEDTPVTIDVVANDTDVDGDARSLASVGGASHGSVSIVSGKAFYSPAANYNGGDAFTYVVSDGHGQATGNVTVTINPVNDAPFANSQAVITNGNSPLAITLTGSDVETISGSLIYTVTTGPVHGSLAGAGPNLTYTPALNYCGSDSFKFTVTDTGDGSAGPLTSPQATVSINVNDTLAPTITLNDLTLIFQGGLKIIFNGNHVTIGGQTFTLPNGTITLFGHTITRNGANVTVDGQAFAINGQTILLATPNGNYQTIAISDLVAAASDGCDAGVSIAGVTIAQVSSDEPQNAAGNNDGNTTNDIVIANNCKSVQLRVERDTTRNGRVYAVTLKARDAAGNIRTTTALVTVPKGAGFGNAVNDGPSYTINGTCP